MLFRSIALILAGGAEVKEALGVDEHHRHLQQGHRVGVRDVGREGWGHHEHDVLVRDGRVITVLDLLDGMVLVVAHQPDLTLHEFGRRPPLPRDGLLVAHVSEGLEHGSGLEVDTTIVKDGGRRLGEGRAAEDVDVVRRSRS